ncbi:T9SS type A sorting domain-containing protein [Kaistella sp. 97-N-M2]|uniref:T9SS type A sorting domain-containing protein n=1 Tax=Kaistella sp. 97-N-M2 TaxID=2908645 RepID=UPI001F37254C|nr:T9SS type A sorting domain-containing protein [Kaistella sp. 97-N-M2]UJF29792.1 T9SS type A sorting domain-containing protein [Kaistella sp. 97-N-M2]
MKKISILFLSLFSAFLFSQCADPLATSDSAVSKNKIYPNPSNGTFTFVAGRATNVSIADVSGRVIYTGNVVKGTNVISVKTTSGVYVLIYQAEGKKESTKLIIK